ncbi:MAG: peptide ABC transporter substrate-binding protein [Clostridiales bacterium]|jgi:oligopeptide transport system substrate-binding protein|nr:peptide ABC transporter substrate-binding protein [Clostridiales bacterium]
MMKKVAAILTAALLMAGCSAVQPSADAQTGGTAEQKLTFAVLDDPDSLDPNYTANTFAGPLFFTAFEGLVKYDTGNNLVPGQAEKWTLSDDGLVYTFYLRDGLKWSDGTALTAGDFEFAWKRLLDPGYASQNSHLAYAYIKNGKAVFDGEMTPDQAGIKALDDKTLEVTLEAPCSFFMSLLATWTYMPVNKAKAENNPDWSRDIANYVSNGPYKLSDYRLGEGIYLVKNENYWNSANVKLETLSFKIMQDTSTALAAYERGELDGMLRVPSSDVPQYRAREDFHSMPQFGNTYWLVNTTSPGLTDPRVRKALALAVDRTSLIEDALQATYDPVLGHVPKGYIQSDGKDYREAGGNYGLKPNADIEEAKRLLAEAGYEDLSTFPRLRLGYYTNDTAKKVAETLQQMYKQNLGIEMDIVSAEWSVFYDQVVQLDYDICAMGDLGTYLHPMAFLSTFAGDAPPLETGWRNPEYDRLLEESLKQTDPSVSDSMMHQAEDLFMNDFPIIPLYSGTQSMMMATYVENWYYSPVGAFVFDQIEILPH